MVKKIENRNIDVTKARGELEEDLLEYVYRTWRQGQTDHIERVCQRSEHNRI